jgi:hypothetical protein
LVKNCGDIDPMSGLLRQQRDERIGVAVTEVAEIDRPLVIISFLISYLYIPVTF